MTRRPLYAVRFSRARPHGWALPSYGHGWSVVWIFEGAMPSFDRLRSFAAENRNVLGAETDAIEIICKWKSRSRFFKRLRRPSPGEQWVVAGELTPAEQTPNPAHVLRTD